MTDIASAVNDDIKEYMALCKKYNESVLYSEDGWPDCYGEHARKLQDRRREEFKTKT